jgi:hypothetical protein
LQGLLCQQSFFKRSPDIQSYFEKEKELYDDVNKLQNHLNVELYKYRYDRVLTKKRNINDYNEKKCKETIITLMNVYSLHYYSNYSSNKILEDKIKRYCDYTATRKHDQAFFHPKYPEETVKVPFCGIYP